MLLGKVFERFASFSPVSVMMRGILTHALPARRIDELFREHASRQYEDELLFSTCVNILGLAVSGSRRSVNAAYRASRDEIEVSVTSLYNKLKGTEAGVSQALARESAVRLEPLIRLLGAARPAPLPGYRLRILDGNHLAGTEHRLLETRTLHSSPLPGQALVVLDPELMLMVDVFPCADAYTQERSLLPDVLETVKAEEVWVADRNFCTTGFLFGLVRKSASFVIRQHASTLSGKRLLGKRQACGRCAAGKLYEQALWISDPATDEELTIRRITLVLDERTADGEQEIHVLTNLPAEVADASSIAELYRGRWTIENAFQELDQSLASEMKTLCYPQAALLCFCVGVVAYNVMSAIKAGFRAAHGDAAALHKISGYYLAEEIASTYRGMMIAIPPRHWEQAFAEVSTAELARIVKQLAEQVHLAQFRKNTRVPKKPPPVRSGGLREKHTSTARLLTLRTRANSTK